VTARPNMFNWRPAGEKASLIPAEHGTEVVTLIVITHGGGYTRPIDISPNVSLARWDVRCPEVPLLVTTIGNACINRDVRFWTTPAEYRAAVESLSDYHDAPSFVPGTICCPLIFVRPVDIRPEFATFYTADDMAPHRFRYEACVTWPDGNTGAAPERWNSVHISGPNRNMSPYYLDRGGPSGSDQPFRWCHLVEFFPPEVFTDMRAAAERSRDYQLEKISAYEAVTR